MTIDNQDESDNHSSDGRSEAPLAEGLTDVLNAVFSVGAAITKTMAEATAVGKLVARAPESAQGPLGEMLYYGVSVVSNVIGLVVSGMGKVVSSGNEKSHSKHAVRGGEKDNAPPQREDKRLPRVHQGGSLRIPLSMENPGDQPMKDLVFVCLQMKGKDIAAGAALTEQTVRFQPECLEIASRDFEKLTVFIDTDAKTATGRYEALIGVGGGGMELQVEFDVAQAEQTR